MSGKVLFASIVLISALTVLSVQGQKDIPATETVIVSGQVEKETVLTLASFSAYSSKPIPDVVITNHLGEARGTAKGLRGVSMKEVLKDIAFKAESPKILSEFYLTFVASDGYAVVYSWNEIFNTSTGDNIFLITEKEGKKLAEMTERILVLTPTDFKTGRRHIKGLSKIVVGRYGH